MTYYAVFYRCLLPSPSIWGLLDMQTVPHTYQSVPRIHMTKEAAENRASEWMREIGPEVKGRYETKVVELIINPPEE